MKPSVFRRKEWGTASNTTDRSHKRKTELDTGLGNMAALGDFAKSNWVDSRGWRRYEPGWNRLTNVRR